MCLHARAGLNGLFLYLRAFFEYWQDPVDVKNIQNLFIQNDLRVTHEPCFQKDFGCYHVIYLDFSVCFNLSRFCERVRASGYKNRGKAASRRAFQTRIGPHQFLADVFSRRLSERGWREALRRLTELTRLKTIVLVDEFDTPMACVGIWPLRAFITVSSLIDPNGWEIVEQYNGLKRLNLSVQRAAGSRSSGSHSSVRIPQGFET